MGEATPVSVRNIISLFERQSSHESVRPVKRAKSLQNLSRPAFKKSQSVSDEFALTREQIQQLEKNLTGYETYSKDLHISYQNQIVFILADVAVGKNSPNVQRKSELCEALKTLQAKLNSVLPSEHRDEPDRVVSLNDEPIQVSVRNLKQLFEKQEAKVELGKSGLRRAVTFNTKSDFKYVPYQHFKANGKPRVEKQFSLDAYFPKRNGSSDEENASSEGSDSEGTLQNEVD